MFTLLRYSRTLARFLALPGLSVAYGLAGFAGQAAAADWRLVRMSGDVRVHAEASGSWTRATAGQALQPGDSVWAGRASRAMIATDDGTVLLKARSLVKVPSQALPEGMTVLFQGKGTVKASVRKKDSQHFSVQTPFLAAVVKGTEFTLGVGSRSSRLSVTEGVVGAVDTRSGRSVDVGRGESLSASHTRGAGFSKENTGGARSGGSSVGSGAADGNDDDRGDVAFGPGRGGGRGNGNPGNGGGNGGGHGGGHGHGHGHGHGPGHGHGHGHGRGNGNGFGHGGF